jgi:formylglycine-generating enzyme required for sulfatase activity
VKAYTEIIEHSEATIDMVPIPAGTFLMGSPQSERDRNDAEGPQRSVRLESFWMSKCEITWDVYEEWMLQLGVRRRQQKKLKPTTRDKLVDAITEPTQPFTDMTFGMGKEGCPAICMTQLAAKTFCRWLSAKTGRYHRLPTEAEWEYACRAGTTTAYHFGDTMDELDEYAWHYGNSDDKYHKVGEKKPNAWGLYDMHGNVAEWVLDQYLPNYDSTSSGKVVANPLVTPTRLYPRVVRGGSWDDDAEMLRSAARGQSDPSWKEQDPQLPKSIWYHTDALHVGFRIVRPLREPSDREKQDKWERSLPIQDGRE